MIERGHLLALQAATSNAEVAFKDADLDAVELAVNQLRAIAEIEVARRSILAKFGVPDITPKNPTTSIEIQVQTPEDMAELTFGQTLRTFRERATLSGAQLATRAGMSQGMLSNLENDKWKGAKTSSRTGWTFTTVCETLGLNSNDQEAKILAQKCLGQYPRLTGEVKKFFSPKGPLPLRRSE